MASLCFEPHFTLLRPCQRSIAVLECSEAPLGWLLNCALFCSCPACMPALLEGVDWIVYTACVSSTLCSHLLHCAQASLALHASVCSACFDQCVCSACFEQCVQSQAASDTADVRARSGRVCCPMMHADAHCGAPFAERLVAASVSENTFEQHRQAGSTVTTASLTPTQSLILSLILSGSITGTTPHSPTRPLAHSPSLTQPLTQPLNHSTTFLLPG